ncbi:MAG: hypothetical protein IBJ18_03465 [Phycisphaerales bacterium]|nr:hypothetical protein [Phycisphaerales bacterium]
MLMGRRRINTEISTEGLGHLVRAYAAITTYLPQYVELEQQIVAMYNTAAKKPVTYSDISRILRTSPSAKENVARRVAWTSQHIFGLQAKCVNYPIVQHADEPKLDGSVFRSYRSPVVDQVSKSLGIDAKAVKYHTLVPKIEQTHYANRIDSVLIDAAQETVYCVKGCLASQVEANRRREPLSGGACPLLFASDRPLENVHVPTQHLRGLLLAMWSLNCAFPNMTVKGLFIVVDDPEAGWEFQAHALTYSELDLSVLKGRTTDISATQLLASSTTLKKNGIDIQSFERVANIPVKDPLSALPMDRATRSHMILNAMWVRQASSDKLSTSSMTSLGQAVEQRHMISYPADLLRHDIEDCLEQRGLVERPFGGVNAKRYALTPEGIAHILLLRRQFARDQIPLTHIDADAHILAPVRKQAALWARHHDGINVTD